MFTGIVGGMAKVVALDKKHNSQTHIIELEGTLGEGLTIGASARAEARVTYPSLLKLLLLIRVGECSLGCLTYRINICVI